MGRVIRKDNDERRVWALAGDGWREELETYGALLLQRLNTPMSRQIDELFRCALGMKRISDSWHWQRMSRNRARSKLDAFIDLRNSLAHRSKAKRTVRKDTVLDYETHVLSLVRHSTFAVAGHLRETLGFSATRTVRL